MKAKKVQSTHPSNLSQNVPVYFRKLQNPVFRDIYEKSLQSHLESMQSAILLSLPDKEDDHESAK